MKKNIWCTKCNSWRSEEDYHRSSRNSSGRQSFCKECQCAARRDSYRKNPEAAAEYARKYQEANAEKIREAKAQYRADNYLAEILRHGKNRARRAGLPGDRIEVADLLADWVRRGITPEQCAYCGGEFEEIEHMHPLSREGSPGHVLGNLAPSCKSCNSSKRQRHWVEYLADRSA